MHTALKTALTEAKKLRAVLAAEERRQRKEAAAKAAIQQMLVKTLNTAFCGVSTTKGLLFAFAVHGTDGRNYVRLDAAHPDGSNVRLCSVEIERPESPPYCRICYPTATEPVQEVSAATQWIAVNVVAPILRSVTPRRIATRLALTAEEREELVRALAPLAHTHTAPVNPLLLGVLLQLDPGNQAVTVSVSPTPTGSKPRRSDLRGGAQHEPAA